MPTKEKEEEEGPQLGLEEGLHPDTYALLMQFLPHGRFLEEDGGANAGEPITDKTVCVAYRPEDVDVISKTLQRLAGKHDEKETRDKKAASERVLLQLESSSGEGDAAYESLMSEGVVRLDGVLSHAHCDALLLSINAKLARDVLENNPFTCESGYGAVLCREYRWDMYLRNEDEYAAALTSMLLGDAGSPLGRLLGSLFECSDCGVHEFSALICDAGANTQPIHPDTQVAPDVEFTKKGPMYTMFIALQDIDANMGATIFLPRTNTQYCHEQHKGASTKDAFLSSREYRQSTLLKGDCAIMDSRLLHCGDANDGKRRVLMYITLKNPRLFPLSLPPIPRGSKWSDLEFNVTRA